MLPAIGNAELLRLAYGPTAWLNKASRAFGVTERMIRYLAYEGHTFTSRQQSIVRVALDWAPSRIRRDARAEVARLLAEAEKDALAAQRAREEVIRAIAKLPPR